MYGLGECISMKTIAKIGITCSQSELESKPARWEVSRPGLRNLLCTLLMVGAICVLSPLTSPAAGVPGSSFDDDAPNTAHAAGDARALRLSNVEGQVRVVQDGQVIADPAYNNLPLFEGSQVITGNDGRAEIQLEDGSLARLSPNTTLTFSVLKQEGTSTHTDVVLNGGLAYFELQPSIAEHSLRVSYGPATFSATSFSVVRITLDQPPGNLAVFSGNVHLDRGDQLQLDIHGGESLSLDLSDMTRYNLAESITPDSWDSWNADRDQVLNGEAGERTAATNSYVNSQGVGMSDLDANGNWYDVPGTGYVWSPYDAQAVGAAFDPYGFGRWVFYPRFGYVWVSGYDWGYAPFQCGLWNYYDNFGWGWAPGAGGCNPWWGFGGGGWGYNIGRGPRGYLPPRRPIPIPGRPHPLGVHELRAANVIMVDRRPASAVNMALYAHPTQPVTIAGHTVEPLKPVAPRQAYDRPAGMMARQPGGYYPSPTYPAAGSYVRPATGYRPPAATYSGHTQSAPAPAAHPSAPSGGGGGGHPAGGGGGGGGTHK
jgi:FecR protein